MPPPLHMDTIHIVESLTTGRTGFRLFEDLEPIGIATQPPINVRFWTPHTAADFLRTLNVIAADAGDSAPLLHIEAHGTSEGIETASGELLTWRDFKQELVAINAATRMHLLVVLAACKGVWLMQAIQPVDRAPFAIMIGPNRIVHDWEIAAATIAFYKSLLTARSLQAALDAMNGAIGPDEHPFVAIPADGAFRTVYQRYLGTAMGDEPHEQRVQRMLATIDESRMSHFERTIRRGKLHLALRDHKGWFTYFRDQFFFNDLFPENMTRFPVTFEDCLPDR
jgi:hypothetical protein